MYAKLAMRNVARSARDYLIYFITVVLTVAIMFAFNSLLFSADVKALSSAMSDFNNGIVFISVIVVLVVALLISYTTSFILKKRKKEFGMYLLLGMERKSVSGMFLLENVVMGLISFIIGILVGFIPREAFTAIIMSVFKSPYQIQMGFSLNACLLTLGYTAIIYLFALVRCSRYLKKTRICDLLISARSNEKMFIKKPGTRLALLVIGLAAVCGSVVGLHLLFRNLMETSGQNAGMALIFSMVLIIVLLLGIVAITFCASALFAVFTKNSKRFKYKNTNLFLCKQVTSKMNTNGLLMGGISVMLLLTFVGLGFSLSFRNETDNRMKRDAPYELSVVTYHKGVDFSRALALAAQEGGGIKASVEYRIYDSEGNSLKKFLAERVRMLTMYHNNDLCIKLSDYNALRRLMGYSEVKLAAGKFLLHSDDDVLAGEVKKSLFEGFEISAGAMKLGYSGQNSEPFGITSNLHESFLVVVPDSVTFEEIASKGIAVNTERKLAESLSGQFWHCDYGTDLVTGEPYSPQVLLRETVLNNNRGTMVMMIFMMFYLALIFIFMSGAILSIQQLSDSAEHRERFQILKKLGVDDRNLAMLVFKQLLVYFVTPLILPVVIGAVATVAVLGTAFQGLLLPGALLMNFGIAVGIFLLLYLCYFLATYFGFWQNINSARR